MRKILATFVAIAAATAITNAHTAHAAAFSPPNAINMVFEGDVEFRENLTFNCTMTAHVLTTNPDGAGNNEGYVYAAGLSNGFLCSLVSLQQALYPIAVLPTGPSGVPATDIEIQGISVVTAMGGTCTGNLWADWSDGAPATITFSPLSTLTGGCTIRGTLSQVSGPALTITQ
ncbi:hypothetical protein [Caulobacter mirabilis]|uniref:Protein activator of alkane oxidation PraB n=1 Tax=Caulobacter mirabilis TaxID=69666 RepID=A0A2D2AW80_9CAUL|nr:hypothetical protein [Caulobacter mirabilis]ATQ42264.1 hypothetical protein CSW64_07450 [Caulobacter mirabilis]